MLTKKKKKKKNRSKESYQNSSKSYWFLFRKVRRHWMNFKISEMTNDNRKAINYGKNYPIYQLTPS